MRYDQKQPVWKATSLRTRLFDCIFMLSLHHCLPELQVIKARKSIKTIQDIEKKEELHMLSRKALDTIIKGIDPDRVSTTIHKALQTVETIRTKLEGLAARHRSISTDSAKKLAELDKEVRAAQKSCPHWDTTFQGDPSGSSDSSTTCNICGLEL